MAKLTTIPANGSIRPGDKMTFSDWGYDRKGREIRFGRFVANGRTTKAKIVKLKVLIANTN